jgi:hypothetical protein
LLVIFEAAVVFCYMKVMRSGELERIRENFLQAIMARRSPEGMLLARAKHRESGFWCLMWLSPQKDNLALHNNFRVVEPEHMPKEAVPLAGSRRTFEKFFTYEKPPAPARKPDNSRWR